MAVLLVDEYSKDQIKEAAVTCPAIQRYLKLIQSPTSSFEDKLRRERHTFWLRSALAVYFNSAPDKDICRFWSESADSLILKAWNYLGLNQMPLGLFALGKLGSMELNLSSDVDLLVTGAPENLDEATRSIKYFKRLLSDPTEMGFTLRVDFDLRPDGSWGPLIVSIPHFQDHYWSRGETWERLAMIRLRSIAGPEPLIESIKDLAERFCYRKYLDFTLMEDLKSLRTRIHAKTLTTPSDALDLKLCVGGIRDAELFIHSLQVIHGGRHPSLRSPETSIACEKLAEALPDSQYPLKRLLKLYWVMRNLENKVQIYSDEQTHTLHKSGPYPKPVEDMWALAQSTTNEINQIVSGLLGDLDHTQNQLPKSLERQNEWLKNLGFSQNSISKLWPEIIKASALSHRKDRDENARKDFLYTFVTSLATRSFRQDLALGVFLDFVRSVRAKSTLFNLILRNAKLMDKLVILFASSPYMGQLIASRPELIDSFLYGLHELSDDTEESLQLLFEKRQLAEIHAAISFFVHLDPEPVSHSLSLSADEIALNLRQLALAEIPGSNFEILCLGKWGSKEMGFNSDLDFVLVKDGNITPDDHRASKRFINFMTSSQKGGRIYDIDMRLRPSGNSGPLLVSRPQLVNYLKTRAQPWERQSYLKMRPLQTLNGWSQKVLIEKPLSSDELNELARIRRKLIKKPQGETVDIKYAPGGLVELEFAAQTAILKKQILSEDGSTPALIQLLAKNCPRWKSQKKYLITRYLELRTWEQLLRLTMQSSSTSLSKSGDSLRQVSAHLNYEPEDFFVKVCQSLEDTCQILKDLDPIYTFGTNS